MDNASKILLVFVFIFGSYGVNAEWRKKPVNTLAWLKTVHFVNADSGWIGGSKGVFLKTIDGGDTWVKQPSFTRDTIKDIFFLDNNNGWLLCERDIYSLGRKASSYLLRTSNAGKTWEKVEFANKRRQRMTKILFAKNGFGLAIGETGALFGIKDDNRSWAKLSMSTSYLMSDGVFLDEFRSVVVGGGGTILFSEDAGTTWNPAVVSGKPSKFNAVFFSDSRNGWAVGYRGVIFQTFNGGRLWRQQRSNTRERLNDVFFINSSEGWAIGNDGMILHTQTAGNVWQKARSRSSHKLESIAFSGDRGWIVGFGGTVLMYEKGKPRRGAKPRLVNRR